MGLTISQSNNIDLFSRAQHYLVGGVNSPVRSFNHVGNVPKFIQAGSGAWISDTEDKRYIDYVGAWGPAILGHGHTVVKQAISDQLQHGIGFGAPHILETELAAKICAAIPSIEQIRFTNSGTEAVMGALRLARGYSKRDGIIKFEGCYHGHSDAMLVKAGSGALSHGVVNSAGVPAAVAQDTYCAEYNNLDSVRAIFESKPEHIATVIVEPIAGNMGCVPPVDDFLPGLRDLCNQFGSLLIFDEVMTGFRINYGGVQTYFDIKPDITVLGKIIGGGMPIGAYGANKNIMNKLAPLGPVYQAGTLSGNPLTMAAGIATLSQLEQQDFYQQLQERTDQLAQGIGSIAQKHNIVLSQNHIGGMFSLFFGHQEVVRYYRQVITQSDTNQFKKFFHSMLNLGVYLAPSPYECGFVSGAHDETIIEQTLIAVENALKH